MTPSSKVVGDLAQFMVQNELDEHSLVERAETLNFPQRSLPHLQLNHHLQGIPVSLLSHCFKLFVTALQPPNALIRPWAAVFKALFVAVWWSSCKAHWASQPEDSLSPSDPGLSR